MNIGLYAIDQERIGQRLKMLRKKSGISVEKLAEELWVSENAIYKWHRGDSLPDLQNLTLLSRFYGVSLDYLVNGERGDDNELSPLPIFREKLRSIFSYAPFNKYLIT